MHIITLFSSIFSHVEPNYMRPTISDGLLTTKFLQSNLLSCSEVVINLSTITQG